MVRFLYKDPRITSLVLLLIIAMGLVAYQLLPRREDPELTARWAFINTNYPGADAERVEALVTEVIERELKEVEELQKIESVSRDGLSSVTIEIRDDIDDVDPIITRIRDRMEDVNDELPPEASRPKVEHDDDMAAQMVIAIEWLHDSNADMNTLNRLALKLEDQLRSVPGTKGVEQFGQVQEEVLVELDAQKLESARVSPEEIAQALQRADTRVAAGAMRGESRDLFFEVSGEYETLADIEKVIIRQNDQGVTLRLGDLGYARRANIEPVSNKALINGERSIVIAVFADESVRLDHWSTQINEVHNAFSAELKGGIKSRVIFDQNTYTEDRFENLTMNFMLGVGCVFLVILVMMGWRSAILVGAALPAVSMLTLFGLWLMGIPIHQMSITGLIIALGLMIDNAIVVVDQVKHRMHTEPPLEAVTKATGQLWIPLGGSTLTTVLTFMPIALMPGGAGEFVGTIAIGVIIALISSLLFSMLIISVLTAWMRGGTQNASLAFWRSGLRISSLAFVYEKIVRFVVKHPLISIPVILTPAVIGFMIFPSLKQQFFPTTERNQVLFQVKLSEKSSLAATEKQVREINAFLATQPEIKETAWFVGRPAPRFYYNMAGGSAAKSSNAEGVMTLHKDIDDVMVQRLQHEMNQRFPNAFILVRRFEQGPPVTAPIEMQLTGPDLNELSRLGSELRSRLAQEPGVSHTETTLPDPTMKMVSRVDEDDLYASGLTPRELAMQMDNRLEGVIGGALVEQSEELPIRVRVNNDARSDLAQLRSLTYDTPDGRAPLTAVVNFEPEAQITEITRKNGVRINSIRAYVNSGELPMEITASFQNKLGDFQLPDGYTLSAGGDTEARSDAINSMLAFTILIMIILAATLVLTFRSFRLAGLIGMIGIFSSGFAMLALWLLDTPFGFMAVVGMMGLIGVAINDSIVVIAGIREDEAARKADPEALTAVIIRSSRHVFSTTITTIAGFTPLLIGGGGFWPPLAIPMAGGVIGATLLALLLVPAAYRLMFRYQFKINRNKDADSETSTSAMTAGVA